MRVLAASLVVALGLIGVPATPVGPAARASAGAGPTSFSDVSADHRFFGHITWMADEGIATGFVDGTYRPGASVSRAAMAAFLYRAAGRPAFASPAEATFDDVSTNHPFFTEVEWLAAEGITTGFVDGTFRPGLATSRQAMAAYLHRASGEPAFADPAVARFADVPLGSTFFHQVEWLVAQEITTGFGDGTFRPLASVSRQSMAAFVFRQQHQAPTLAVDPDFVTDADVPWDLVWTPDGVMLYTERAGRIMARIGDEEPVQLVGPESPEMADFFIAYHESGLLGIELDPDFDAEFNPNRTFYTCQGEVDEDGPGGVDPGPNSQVVRWTLAPDSQSVTRVDEVLDLAPWAAIEPAQEGFHGGCRIRRGAEGNLWVSAGDAGCGTYPQDLLVPGGKVLRFDPQEPDYVPADNPYVDGDPRDDFVVTYGHRNPQGLALRPGTSQMWSIEHGSYRDDEVNLLVAATNYGWDPVGPPRGPEDQYCGYDESRPMTDLDVHPDASPARWTSGDPTIATSGGTWLDDPSWGGWDGGLVVATLKEQHVRVLFFTESGAFIEERRPAELDQTYGRLRTPRMGPDGDLFVTTSNGHHLDRIVRISATP